MKIIDNKLLDSQISFKKIQRDRFHLRQLNKAKMLLTLDEH